MDGDEGMVLCAWCTKSFQRMVWTQIRRLDDRVSEMIWNHLKNFDKIHLFRISLLLKPIGRFQLPKKGDHLIISEALSTTWIARRYYQCSCMFDWINQVIYVKNPALLVEIWWVRSWKSPPTRPNLRFCISPQIPIWPTPPFTLFGILNSRFFKGHQEKWRQ